MSPTTAKHKTVKKPKSRVPIVNVFDEDEGKQEPLQPARHPVVVEIEDALPEAPLQSPSMPQVSNDLPQVSMDAPVAAPAAPQAPLPQYQAPAPQVEPQAPQVQGTAAEPALPSFFAQDLQPNTAPQAPQQQANTPLGTIEATIPQAVVGEINQEAASGGNGKKILGIVLMVIALVVLGVGGLILYAKNLFAPVALPTPTPTPQGTPRPAASTTPTPVASGSATASASAEMKKKVKVDVLNGTKTAGLAAKEAAVLKAAGFVTGTVGNGKPENAGTIVVPPAYKALATEITTLLKEFTFTISENAKVTTIQVTLGETK